ncbi:MAG: hypothetical protein ACW981_19670 [Candidatus Hodarchaeales archaeon]|jgi:hypothetical protein
MAGATKSIDLRNIFYPKCPYNDSMFLLMLRLSVIVLGTIGISFFNIWVAVVYLTYSVVYNLLVWPVIHCQYCYYKVKVPKNDKDGGNVIELLPLDKWKESYLQKHVDCGKKWGSPNLMILWLGPIGLIVISFFLNFSLHAILTLIAFIVTLAGIGIYTRYKICPTCAFMEECHANF